MPTSTHDLDDIDRDLMDAVQRQGRASLTDLGQAISLGVSATRARLQALEARGVISAYVARTTPAALGYPLHAVVRMKVHGSLYDQVRKVMDRQPQIIRCLRVTGESCYNLEIVATDMADLERITADLALVGSVVTDLVYEEVVSRPIPAQRAPG